MGPVNKVEFQFMPDDKIKVKHFDLTGVITHSAIDRNGIIVYLIEWVDNNNEVNSRWFDEDQLEISN